MLPGFPVPDSQPLIKPKRRAGFIGPMKLRQRTIAGEIETARLFSLDSENLRSEGLRTAQAATLSPSLWLRNGGWLSFR
jgi:hypothetical protein